jgi:hypothetical protein
MNRIAISCAIGAGAGLALAGAYLVAPYAGVTLTPTAVLVFAAVVAFGSSVALLTMLTLAKPEKKKAPSTKRLSDLLLGDFAHFPTAGMHIVLRPDSVVEELDVVRHPDAYAKKDIFLTIKKSSGKTVFNPILIKRLFENLSRFENFVHILLVNEHDEYIGYMPAGYARWHLLGEDAESLIRKYIVDVLADPKTSAALIEIGGLSKDETIYDNERVADALKRAAEGFFRGFVVFKDKRNRKPVGVIYTEDLVRLSIRTDG